MLSKCWKRYSVGPTLLCILPWYQQNPSLAVTVLSDVLCAKTTAGVWLLLIKIYQTGYQDGSLTIISHLKELHIFCKNWQICAKQQMWSFSKCSFQLQMLSLTSFTTTPRYQVITSGKNSTLQITQEDFQVVSSVTHIISLQFNPSQ